MQTIQEQFSAHQVLIEQVTQRIKRFQQELASGPPPALSKATKDLQHRIAQHDGVVAEGRSNAGDKFRRAGAKPIGVKPDARRPPAKPGDDSIAEHRQAVRVETDRIGRYIHVQGALEAAKKEYLNLTGSRYGE